MPLHDIRYLLLRIRIACTRWVYQVVIETSRFTAVVGRRRVLLDSLPYLDLGQEREPDEHLSADLVLASTRSKWYI